MTDASRVVVARYILAADRHFEEAAEAARIGAGEEYERHVEAAILASKAATEELIAGADEDAIAERLRRFVG